MRSRLEGIRLEFLALFRALDRLHLCQGLPAPLRALFEVDADMAEALWALDQSPKRIDFGAMVRDTERSMASIPELLSAFWEMLDLEAQAAVRVEYPAVRATLEPKDAYLQIPGRDPSAG